MTQEGNLYDVIIVGGGPAGLTAALYLARAQMRVLVVEKDRFGGQIAITEEVVNYPGIPTISGDALGDTMRKQAQAFGAEFLSAEARSIEPSQTARASLLAAEKGTPVEPSQNPDDYITAVKTSRGSFEAFAVLIATGAAPRKGEFEGEDEFSGHGVAYCATCDGEFFKDREIVVSGGGYAAAEEAVFLTRFAKRVTLAVRTDAFTCAQSVADKAINHPGVRVQFNTYVTKAEGTNVIERVYLEHRDTGETEIISDDKGVGLFVFAGYKPATEIAPEEVARSEYGALLVDAQCQTNLPGIFAAGDVCEKSLRQVATAVGQAAEAASSLQSFAEVMRSQTGMTPVPLKSEEPAQAPSSEAPTRSVAAESNAPGQDNASVLDEAMRAQLSTVFGRMTSSLQLKLHVDESQTAGELSAWIQEIAALTDKLSIIETPLTEGSCEAALDESVPYVEVCDEAGNPCGLAFHGVPGGHEFTSFVLGLYNTAGPGQPIAEEDKESALAIDAPVRMSVLVGLSCTMCPDTVVAAQRVASLNEHVTAHVYDLNLHPSLKDRFHVMSVPCLVVEREGKETTIFGKKDVASVLEAIAKLA